MSTLCCVKTLAVVGLAGLSASEFCVGSFSVLFEETFTALSQRLLKLNVFRCFKNCQASYKSPQVVFRENSVMKCE